VAKLNFILALVECIIEIAKSRSSPLSESVHTNIPRSQSHGFIVDGGHVVFVSEEQRRLEQLVLYVRSLQLLTSSIQLAKDEMTAGRLQPSNAVKNSKPFIDLN
jgi:serine/threonine-protein kinase ULK/ATG1